MHKQETFWRAGGHRLRREETPKLAHTRQSQGGHHGQPQKSSQRATPEVAANGLIHRRALLNGVLIAGAMGSGFSNSLTGAAQQSRFQSMRGVSRSAPLSRPTNKPTRCGKNAQCARSLIPRTSRAPARRVRRTICSTARSRQTVCISSCRARASLTSIQISTAWRSMAW